jgi:hypothetical protein
MQIGIGLSVVKTRTAAVAGNPAPTTSGISPTTAKQWAGATEITVTGTGFVDGSTKAHLDGVEQTTIVDSSTQLRFTIPSSDTANSPLQTAGDKAITVVTTPAGGTSGAQTLTVTARTIQTTTGLRARIQMTLAQVTLNGSLVSSVADLSGNGFNAAQVNATNQPTYVASLAALGNRGAADFDGVDNFLQMANLSNLIAAGTYLVIAVAVVERTSNVAAYYDNNSIFGDLGGYSNMPLKNGNAGAGNYDGTDDEVYTPITLSVGQIISTRHASNVLYVRNGLNAEASVASGNTTDRNNATCLGRAFSATTSWFDGKLGEINFFNTAISSDDHDAMIRELKVYYSL